MPTWQAITKTRHLHAGWQKFTDYNFARAEPLAPLLMAELTQALAYYPLGFIKNADQGYQLVALQSLNPGLNLYVNQQGKWLAPYVPSYYRSYPFRLIANTAQDYQLTLCFDADSGLVHEKALPDDVALFTPDGAMSAPMQALMDFLNQCEVNRQATQGLVNQLAEHQLLHPWPVKLQSGEQTPDPGDQLNLLQGLYKIDEAALKSLDPQVLSTLAQSGALALAYGQLFSQTRLQDFKRRYQHYEQQQSAAPSKVDLDQLFNKGDDLLRF